MSFFLPEYEVPTSVRLPCLDERYVSNDGLLHDVVNAVKVPHFPRLGRNLWGRREIQRKARLSEGEAAGWLEKVAMDALACSHLNLIAPIRLVLDGEPALSYDSASGSRGKECGDPSASSAKTLRKCALRSQLNGKFAPKVHLGWGKGWG